MYIVNELVCDSGPLAMQQAAACSCSHALLALRTCVAIQPQVLTVCQTQLQVLTKALQLHPTAAGLWTSAAAWELRQNGNAAAARSLMQRGLRMASDSAHL